MSMMLSFSKVLWTVLHGDKRHFIHEDEDYPEWSNLQTQNASLSKNSKHIVVKDASHYIHLLKLLRA
ncbi:hypothetical protein V7147_04060 [Bacillus sp. JJ1521]|uniref:hypothetical protein n=1 Tax=Bacillus sp. JJ1521 TaxID=3122957 RepID=UPI0030006AEC